MFIWLKNMLWGKEENLEGFAPEIDEFDSMALEDLDPKEVAMITSADTQVIRTLVAQRIFGWDMVGMRRRPQDGHTMDGGITVLRGVPDSFSSSFKDVPFYNLHPDEVILKARDDWKADVHIIWWRDGRFHANFMMSDGGSYSLSDKDRGMAVCRVALLAELGRRPVKPSIQKFLRS